MIDEKELIDKLQEWADEALPFESDIVTDVIGLIEEQPKVGEWIPSGTIRRLDDLGRVLIPKAIRKELELEESEPLEINVNKNRKIIVLKKYEPEPYKEGCK